MKMSVATRAAFAAAMTLLGSLTVHAEPKKWTEVKIVTEGGFYPWNFTKPDGTLGGFEIDLAHDLCKRMGVTCTITAQSFDSMIPALNAGKFDAIIDDVAITPKRKKAIAFSVPYASLCYTFAAAKGSDLANMLPPQNKVISLEDAAQTAAAMDKVKAAMKGKTIGTLSAGTSVTFVDTYLKDAVQVRQYKTPEARDLDLVSQRVDVIVGSKDALLGVVKKQGADNVVLAGPCFQGGVVGEGSGVGLRKGDTELKAMFDKAIKAAQADGTIKKLSEATFGMDVTPMQK
ncbi:transporter substrate-binding domain-containing protein [Martelella alba]|uniref:Transporter substrate-binding domain-containing protein n=1 Tax=Martelella alba TaxID=2590451 RepID=A0ABY2SP81_9HYPH|nr:transporter substrate-binding domain-containing protein [Martelella alba]TKI06956.1 transporter substrate-binding domain-containing protein [Martelella alba]